MSVEYKEYPEYKLAELQISGKMKQEDIAPIFGQLETFITTHGNIKFLEEIHEFSGMDPSMFWEGLKFDIKHLKDVSHCAVVSDMGWVGPLSKSFGVFLPCKIRVFSLAETEEARKWLQEAN